MNNFLVRTISGTIFLGIILTSLFYPIVFGVVFVLIIGVMYAEYFNITLKNQHKIARLLSSLTGVTIFSLFFLIKGYNIDPKYLFLVPLPILGALISILYEKKNDYYKTYPYVFLPILYIALPLALTNFIVFQTSLDASVVRFDGLALLGVMIILWASDVGAYIFGITFGQKNGHRLFPSISPKKSWEGYWGGLFSSIVAGLLLSYFQIFPFGIVHSIVLAIIINISGTIGDLLESQLKRNFGVKDSGKIMPGHGGLLDRFDGALLAFPAAISYIILMGLIN